MQEYIGMNFHDWCKLDPDDERKINYTLHHYEGTVRFDSTEVVSGLTRNRVIDSTIEDIKLINNEWFVVLRCKY